MTTASDLITRVRYPMRDTAAELFADVEILDYLNEAIVDLCSRARLVHEEDTTCSTTGGTIPFANVGGNTDVLQIRWVTDTAGVEAVAVDPTQFQFMSQGTATEGVDPVYSIWDGVIHLYPAPEDGEAWSVGYFGIPSALTTGSDTFPLTRTWEGKVVHFARAQCYYRLGDNGLGDREIASYEQGLPYAPVYDRNAPGQVVLVLERSAFDTDPDARHLG